MVGLGQGTGGGRRIISADRIVDGTGRPPLLGGGIAIENGRIEAVGPLAHLGLLPDTPVETFPGCTLLPGLVDSHVHLTLSASAFPFRDLETDSDGLLVARGLRNARLALLAGVTTVRDLGARGRAGFDVRDAVAAGLAPGPRILVAGRPVTIPGGHCHFMGGVADGLDEVKRVTSELLEQGADAIKVMATGGNMTVTSDPLTPAFRPEEVRAIIELAHAAGKRVTAHARGVAGIAQVVEAGIDNVEHCRMEVGPGVWGFDGALATRMATAGVTAAPTMAASHRAAELRARGGEVGLRAGGIDTATRQKNAARLREHGVSVILGTDAGASLATFDDAPHVELELLCQAGWTPVEAIAAGTLASARAIGLGDDLGSLEVGKRADLVVVAGDPSQDIGATRRVLRVYRDGRLVAADGQVLAEARRFGLAR